MQHTEDYDHTTRYVWGPVAEIKQCFFLEGKACLSRQIKQMSDGVFGEMEEGFSGYF
jgi:hypothetical protein